MAGAGGGFAAVAALEEVGGVAGLVDLAVGALGVEVDGVLADEDGAGRGDFTEQLEIIGHGRLTCCRICGDIGEHDRAG